MIISPHPAKSKFTIQSLWVKPKIKIKTVHATKNDPPHTENVLYKFPAPIFILKILRSKHNIYISHKSPGNQLSPSVTHRK